MTTPEFLAVFPLGPAPQGPLVGRFRLGETWRYGMSDGRGLLVCEDVPDAALASLDFARVIPGESDSPAESVARADLLAWARPRVLCPDCGGTKRYQHSCSCGHLHEAPAPCSCWRMHEECIGVAEALFDARRLAPLVAALDGDTMQVTRLREDFEPLLLVGATRLAVLMPLRDGEALRTWPEATP